MPNSLLSRVSRGNIQADEIWGRFLGVHVWQASGYVDHTHGLMRFWAVSLFCAARRAICAAPHPGSALLHPGARGSVHACSRAIWGPAVPTLARTRGRSAHARRARAFRPQGATGRAGRHGARTRPSPGSEMTHRLTRAPSACVLQLQ